MVIKCILKESFICRYSKGMAYCPFCTDDLLLDFDQAKETDYDVECFGWDINGKRLPEPEKFSVWDSPSSLSKTHRDFLEK